MGGERGESRRREWRRNFGWYIKNKKKIRKEAKVSKTNKCVLVNVEER